MLLASDLGIWCILCLDVSLFVALGAFRLQGELPTKPRGLARAGIIALGLGHSAAAALVL